MPQRLQKAKSQQFKLSLGKLVVVGYFVKPHGLKGALKVRLTQGVIPEININEPVFILLQGGLVPFFAAEKPDIDRSTIVLKLEGIDTIDAAERMVGKEVFIDERQLTVVEEEIGLNSVIGFAVTDVSLGDIGVVSGVLELQHQSVFEIQFKGKEILIPAVDGIVQQIDEETKRIIVDAPAGLVDLYLNG